GVFGGGRLCLPVRRKACDRGVRLCGQPVVQGAAGAGKTGQRDRRLTVQKGSVGKSVRSAARRRTRYRRPVRRRAACCLRPKTERRARPDGMVGPVYQGPAAHRRAASARPAAAAGCVPFGGACLAARRRQALPALAAGGKPPHIPAAVECVGGAVLAGETGAQAALRETREELGLDLAGCRGGLLCTRTRDAVLGQRANSILDVWLFAYNGPPRLDQ